MSENVKIELSACFLNVTRFPARARGKHSAGVVTARSGFYWQITLYRVGPCINRQIIILYIVVKCKSTVDDFFFFHVDWNEIIELLVKFSRTVISYRLHASDYWYHRNEWLKWFEDSFQEILNLTCRLKQLHLKDWP